MTGKALALVNDELRRRPDVDFDFVDPATLELSPPGRTSSTATLEYLNKTIGGATGVILATPEYHGSYSSVMKLVIENLNFPSALRGKPIGLLGVAAGVIGAIKALEHLRSVCSHVGGLVLPGTVSVARVNTVFDDDGRCLDAAIEKRIRGVATQMIDHIQQTICPGIALEEMVRSGTR
jgi:FMN reductase